MTERLHAFFKYFGAKHQSVGQYPPPGQHRRIIEPFAGSAAYATRWYDRNVWLIDKDPKIVQVWDYLIKTKASEIRSLPLFQSDQKQLDDLKGVPQEARALIGFWLYTGSTYPRTHRGPWAMKPEYAQYFWGEHIRTRLAYQVEKIRHWRVALGSYEQIRDVRGLWFLDPPYERAGRGYKCSSAQVDFKHLRDWIFSRRGLVIVCENVGASWLTELRPYFSSRANIDKTSTRKSEEAIFAMVNNSCMNVTDQVVSKNFVDIDEVDEASLKLEKLRVHITRLEEVRNRVADLRKSLDQSETELRDLLRDDTSAASVAEPPPAANIGVPSMSIVEPTPKRSRSEAMKAAWARRRAEEAVAESSVVPVTVTEEEGVH